MCHVDKVETVQKGYHPPLKVSIQIEHIDVCMEVDTGASLSITRSVARFARPLLACT